MNYRKIALGYGLLLAAFSGYVLLDTFVLSSSVQTGANEMNLSLFAENPNSAAGGTDVTALTAAGDTTETVPEAAGTEAAVQNGETGSAQIGTGTGEAAEKAEEAAGTAAGNAAPKAATAAAGNAAPKNGSTTAKHEQTAEKPAATAPPATEAPATEPPPPEPV